MAPYDECGTYTGIVQLDPNSTAYTSGRQYFSYGYWPSEPVRPRMSEKQEREYVALQWEMRERKLRRLAKLSESLVRIRNASTVGKVRLYRYRDRRSLYR